MRALLVAILALTSCATPYSRTERGVQLYSASMPLLYGGGAMAVAGTATGVAAMATAGDENVETAPLAIASVAMILVSAIIIGGGAILLKQAHAEYEPPCLGILQQCMEGETE